MFGIHWSCGLPLTLTPDSEQSILAIPFVSYLYPDLKFVSGKALAVSDISIVNRPVPLSLYSLYIPYVFVSRHLPQAACKRRLRSG